MVEPLTSADVVGHSDQALKEYQAGIMAQYLPYAPLTEQDFEKLANLKPRTLAIMDGSSFAGDCARALDDLNVVLREVCCPCEESREPPMAFKHLQGEEE